MEKYNHNYSIRLEDDKVFMTLGNLTDAGWFMMTKNVGAGIVIGIEYDEFKKDIKDFDFDTMVKKMEETKELEGDLTLIYWLSGGTGYWDRDVYEVIDSIEECINDEKEEDETVDIQIDEIKLQEELKEIWIPQIFNNIIPEIKESKTNDEKWDLFMEKMKEIEKVMQEDVEQKIYEMAT